MRDWIETMDGKWIRGPAIETVCVAQTKLSGTDWHVEVEIGDAVYRIDPADSKEEAICFAQRHMSSDE